MNITNRLQNLQPSYIREILHAATAPGMISLAGGLPAMGSFPMSLMQDALSELSAMPSVFQYHQTAGYRPLLDYVHEHYLVKSNHSAIVCTGSQQGLDLIARAFINSGDEVVVESPSYLGALQVFQLAGAKIIPVDQLHNGPDLDQLKSIFAAGAVKIFYAVPDFHNPSGICWGLSVRKSVAALCREFNITIVEDSPYRDIRFLGESLPLVSSFCSERALVLRSFSKTVAPGLRLGLLSGPEQWVNAAMKVKQAADLHTSVPMQYLLLRILTHKKYPDHLTFIRRLYTEKYAALTNAIKQWLPPQCSFEEVAGGMFIWLHVPGKDTKKLAQEALEQKVAVVPGYVFYPEVALAKPYLRLNFSNSSSEQLNVGMERLSVCLE